MSVFFDAVRGVCRRTVCLGLAGGLSVAAAEVRAAVTELSAEYYRGDGSLADPTKNSRGLPLTEQHYVYFQHAPDGQPGQTSRVTVPDGFKLDNINLANVWTTWTGVAGLDDSCAVTLVGSPSKLWLQDWKYPTIEAGRTLTLDGVLIEQTNMLDFAQLTGGLKLDGRLLMKNGSSYKATSPGMYSTAGATGELTVKDSDLDFFSFDPAADAHLRFFSGSIVSPRWPNHCSQTNVQIRNAQAHITADLRSPSFFPSGTNGLFECLLVSDNSFTPALSQGEQIALRGKAMATNNTGATVSKCILTNDVAFYGRGTLNTGYLRMQKGCTYDFDLANLELGFRIDAVANPNGATDDPSVNFRNGINLRMYDTRPGGTRAVDFSIPVDFYGPVTLDSRDIYSDAVRSLSFNHTLSFHDRSSVECRGNVTVGYRLQPVRYGRYAVADDSTLTEKDYQTSAPCWRRTHDYALGRNAVHNITTYEEVVEVLGEISVDPTAKLIAGVPTNVGNDLYPLFCSLTGRPIDCTLAVQNETEGCSIKWVGGCAYYSNGQKDYGGTTTMGSWLGAEDGYWSNPNNWGASQYPYYGGVDATFKGETRTVVTNDLDNAGCLKLAYLGGAPFILRGKAIKTYRNGLGADATPSVYSTGEIPFVIECPLVANGNFGCMTKTGKGYGLIALMGDVNAAEGVFGPCGNVLVGGTTDCRELVLQKSAEQRRIGYTTKPSWATLAKYFTELIVAKGGVVNVSAQATANTVAGGIWIDRGGVLNVTGRWDWTTMENEHQVNGLLDLSAATVGGDAAQGYFGTGRVRIGATDGTAAVRFGEGVTLETTAADWGTMPIEMASGFTISNRTDWTYAVPGGIRVTGPGHALTVYVAKDTVTTIETGVDGYDFDIVKLGEGKLVLGGNVDGLKRGTLDIRGGTVAFDGVLKVRTLASASCTALAFGSTDGVTASLFVDDDVDLSNLTFRSADGDAEGAAVYQTVLTMPWDCEITGAPVLDGVKLRTVVNADGSKSLQAKACRGLLLLFR